MSWASEAAKAWRAKNPERAREHRRRSYLKNREKTIAKAKAHRDAHKERYRDYEYRRRYGITAERFEAMLSAQGGACALCGTIPADMRRMCVDHDHVTGAVRAILCRGCNTGIGAFAESIERLQQAIEYLRRHT